MRWRLEPLGRVPAGEVNVLHEYQRGRLWVATVTEQTTAGLFCHEDVGFRSVSVVCPFIVSLSDDRDGNLWVGTRRADLVQVRLRTVERDFYGKVPATSITAPDLKQAYNASSAKDAIVLEFDQPVVWMDSLTSRFYLADVAEKVASGAVSGNMVTLKLKEASVAKKITYLKEMHWSQDNLIIGVNGIAALTFCDVAMAPQ